jgi:hypothetical protein
MRRAAVSMGRLVHEYLRAPVAAERVVQCGVRVSTKQEGVISDLRLRSFGIRAVHAPLQSSDKRGGLVLVHVS